MDIDPTNDNADEDFEDLSDILEDVDSFEDGLKELLDEGYTREEALRMLGEYDPSEFRGAGWDRDIPDEDDFFDLPNRFEEDFNNDED